MHRTRQLAGKGPISTGAATRAGPSADFIRPAERGLDAADLGHAVFDDARLTSASPSAGCFARHSARVAAGATQG